MPAQGLQHIVDITFLHLDDGPGNAEIILDVTLQRGIDLEHGDVFQRFSPVGSFPFNSRVTRRAQVFLAERLLQGRTYDLVDDVLPDLPAELFLNYLEWHLAGTETVDPHAA